MKKNIYTLFFFLLVSQICFAQWVQLGLEDKAIKDIAARNSNIFAITSDSGSVYRSTDNGNSWTVIVDTSAVDIAIAPSGTIFMLKAGTLFSSSDNGETWDTLNVEEQFPPHSDLPRPTKVSFNTVGFIFCGLYRRDAYSEWTNIALSTDNGITWDFPGWETDGFGRYLFVDKGEIVISAGYFFSYLGQNSLWDYIYLSPDNGLTWSYLGNAPLYVGNCNVISLCLNGNILLGGSEYSSGLFLSTDSCTTWTQISSLNIQTGLSIESGHTLVGTDSLGVFLFSDDGDSLGSRNDGLTNLNIHTLTIDNNNYVYAGTDNGVWRRPLSEITSVEEEQIDEVPTEFLLSQNYPNPFNPSTRINYQVSSISLVSLVVYDVLGNEIETLVNEEKPAGTYELSWNAENLPSGVYFYRLKAGSFIETKKMILLK